MGALNTESNQTLSVMESECTTTTSNVSELRIRSLTASDKADQFGSEKKLISFTSSSSSFSSLPDSAWEDPFLDFDVQNDNSTLSINILPKLDENSELADGHNEKAKDEQLGDFEIPISILGPAVTDRPPKPSSNHMSTTECPPTQVMERPGNSQYRIPSSVFARTKSNGPVDWSVASNESLFSIHMGGMSFNQDHMYWRSGELGMLPEPSTSSPLFELPSHNQPSGSKATEAGKSCDLGMTVDTMELVSRDNATEAGKSCELGMTVDTMEPVSRDNETEAGKSCELGTAVDTMKSVSRDNSEDQGSKRSVVEERTSHYSVESGSSTKSFAFPILAGETEKVVSARTVKVGPELPKLHPEAESQPKTKPQPPGKPSELERKTSAAIPQASCITWFPCFRCCTYRP